MRLILDAAEDAAHGNWLRETPGGYEWWYFDALSDDGVWAMTCIWFLGNPFSPYYRAAALGQPGDPWEQNALFFALYKEGRLHAYHFTQFPKSQICADEQRPASLRFGPNDLSQPQTGLYRIQIADENANRRTLIADLTFDAPPLQAEAVQVDGGLDAHFWLPAAPQCRVRGQISLRELNNSGVERIAFTGQGYHDHNWGALPFSASLRDWYWARAALSDQRTVILYHVRPRHSEAISHLLLFENGRLTRHDPQANVSQTRYRLNGFGTAYATQLTAQTDGLTAVFHLGARLDSAPFYLRTLCHADITEAGRVVSGTGLGEYFRPQSMSSRIAESAMKARVVRA